MSAHATAQAMVVPPDQLFGRAVEVVAQWRGLAPGEVLEPRGRMRRRARIEAVYLAVVGGNASLHSVARCIGLRHSGLQRGLARVEDGRDDRRYDRALERCEARLKRQARPQSRRAS